MLITILLMMTMINEHHKNKDDDDACFIAFSLTFLTIRVHLCSVLFCFSFY